ncbi:MAG: hypothetical protein JWR16_335 [Nevskia sp.]|nr:hypothetical protein [Nevskia sp.]
MFGISARKATPIAGGFQTSEPQTTPFLTIVANNILLRDRDSLAIFDRQLPPGQQSALVGVGVGNQLSLQSDFVLSLYNEPAQLDEIADKVLALRASGRSTTLIIAIRSTQLADLGKWIDRRAIEGRLAGVRLLLANDIVAVAEALPSRLIAVQEDNVIRMPLNPEVEDTAYKNFYVFSPQLQSVVARIRDYANNGIVRAYLLGGPGSGKTSLAFYYFLVRNKGQFVAVNLMSENTGDKAAVKSLLCGHVTGAFPGAGARSGAFSHARDGVCFLDESHGINGGVMEVLMEALDSSQYLPFGASSKRPLTCALLFATNRSWEHLQNSVNLDEFTRLGAATLEVPELSHREEDMIAVIAGTLARLGARCSTWTAAVGLTEDAWKRIRECRWHGNVRALVRVLESAFVDTASRGGGSLLDVAEIERGIKQWEPETHHSHQIYAGH